MKKSPEQHIVESVRQNVKTEQFDHPSPDAEEKWEKSPEFEAFKAAGMALAKVINDDTKDWTKDELEEYGEHIRNVVEEDPEDAYMYDSTLIYYAYFNSDD